MAGKPAPHRHSRRARQWTLDREDAHAGAHGVTWRATTPRTRIPTPGSLRAAGLHTYNKQHQTPDALHGHRHVRCHAPTPLAPQQQCGLRALRRAYRSDYARQPPDDCPHNVRPHTPSLQETSSHDTMHTGLHGETSSPPTTSRSDHSDEPEGRVRHHTAKPPNKPDALTPTNDPTKLTDPAGAQQP